MGSASCPGALARRRRNCPYGLWRPGPRLAASWCSACPRCPDRTSVRNAISRTISDMTSVALAVTDGTPLFELAAACEVFGVDRGLTRPWYDFVICGQDDAEVGGWLRAGVRHGLEALAGADTVIVPSCRDAAEPPPQALVDAVRAAHRSGARVASL